MKTLYLHIGTHKTGSSALQAFLLLNKENLKEHGFEYPSYNSKFELFQTSNGNGYKFCSHTPAFSSKDRDREIKILKKINKNIIISCEDFFHSPLNDFRLLKKHFKKVIVIAYLRRQDKFFQSAVLQMIKSDKCTDIFDYGHENYAYYSKKLDSLNTLFPVENIVVRPYETDQFTEKSIFADFLNILGLRFNNSYKLPEKIINPSLNRNYAELKRLCNKLPFDVKEIRNVFTNPFWKLSVEENAGEKKEATNIFSPKKRLEIIKKYEEDNVYVAKKYLNRPDGTLFKEPYPEEQENWGEYKGLDLETVVKGLGYVIMEQAKKIDYLESKFQRIGTTDSHPQKSDANDNYYLNKHLKDIAFRLGFSTNNIDDHFFSKLENYLENYGIFDRRWYYKKYPDVERANVNPIKHYINIGWTEGRNLSESFITEEYLYNHPELITRNMCPVVHYLLKS